MKGILMWFPGLLLTASCGTEPERPPAVPYIVTGTVTDSLGGPVRAVGLQATLWRQDDSIAWGGGTSDGNGGYSIEWDTPVAHQYDSLVLLADGSASLSLTPCRPYRSLRIMRTSLELQDLLRDSVHIPMELGLGIEAPILGAGVSSCAVGHNPFGEGTSDFLLELAVHSVGSVPEDSVRGEWHIYFRETRRDLNGPFAGRVVQDTLDLALHMGGDSFIECEPGYRLRIALDPGQRLGDGDLETLRLDVTACPVHQLDPLRFVPFEGLLFAKGSEKQ
jgi:hypothetical protein